MLTSLSTGVMTRSAARRAREEAEAQRAAAEAQAAQAAAKAAVEASRYSGDFYEYMFSVFYTGNINILNACRDKCVAFLKACPEYKFETDITKCNTMKYLLDETFEQFAGVWMDDVYIVDQNYFKIMCDQSQYCKGYNYNIAYDLRDDASARCISFLNSVFDLLFPASSPTTKQIRNNFITDTWKNMFQRMLDAEMEQHDGCGYGYGYSYDSY